MFLNMLLVKSNILVKSANVVKSVITLHIMSSHGVSVRLVLVKVASALKV